MRAGRSSGCWGCRGDLSGGRGESVGPYSEAAACSPLSLSGLALMSSHSISLSTEIAAPGGRRGRPTCSFTLTHRLQALVRKAMEFPHPHRLCNYCALCLKSRCYCRRHYHRVLLSEHFFFLTRLDLAISFFFK